MTKLIARVRCAFAGHDWETDMPSRHSWCRRCARYDDHPAIIRAERRVRIARLVSPLWIRIRRRDLSVHVGWSSLPLPSLHARLHFGLRGGELPGAGVDLNLWRIRVHASIGFLWQDEDGENRSLFHVGASFQTYGISNLACRLRGHRPAKARLMTGYVYCDRCDATLERPERREARAA